MPVPVSTVPSSVHVCVPRKWKLRSIRTDASTTSSYGSEPTWYGRSCDAHTHVVAEHERITVAVCFSKCWKFASK